MEEPVMPAPRPCSSPHTAPVRWLRSECEASPLAPHSLTPEEQHRESIRAFLDHYEDIAPPSERRDGWSPFLRKLFLQVVAQTGRTGIACEYTGMSRQSAYALAMRDRVFAAGWTAAAHFARGPMADELVEKAMDGITESVTRADGTIVTRHRFDTRLSVAMLHRLDKRCDRAEEQGAVYLAALRNWDRYLGLVGDGDNQAAEAILDTPAPGGGAGAQNGQTCQLPERAFPIPVPDPPGCNPDDSVWQDADGRWITTFPPPPDFAGFESAQWDGFNAYHRACTPEEVEVIQAAHAAAEAEELAEVTAFAEAQRDAFFGRLQQITATGSRTAP